MNTVDKTPDQIKDAERLERYLVREELASVMNNTKWHEVGEIIASVFGSHAWFRTKDVRGEEPPTASSWWDRDFEHHRPSSYEWIEWLEIDPIVTQGYRGGPGQDHMEDLTSSLRSKNIPFHLVGNVVRIQCYVRTK